MAKASKAAKPATKPADAPKRAYTSPTPLTDEEKRAHAITVASAQKAMHSIPGFKVKRQVTMPVMKMEAEKIYTVKILDAFRISNYKPEDQENAATICGVVNMETGTLYTFLVPSVVQKNLEEMGVETGEEGGDVPYYVGKIFALQKLPKRPGKRYYDFNILEVEQDEAEE